MEIYVGSGGQGIWGTGPGIVGGPSSNPITVSDDPDAGCWEWVERPCNGGEGHVGNDASCTGSFQGSTTLVNNCNGQEIQVYGRNGLPATDPCAPVGEIGVLSPVVMRVQRIVDEIIDTDLNPCPKAVLAQLKTLTEKSMAAIIAKLDATPSFYRTTIKHESWSPNNGGYPAKSIRTPDYATYNYTILLDPLYSGDANQLGYASILLHEFIHVYLFSLIDDVSNTNPSALDNFPQLFEIYVEKRFGPNPGVIHHEIIANEYVDILSRALQEFQTGIPVANGVEPEQIYSDLAWGGLRETPVYMSDLLTPSDRLRIEKRTAVETRNEIRGEMYPVGIPCN